MARATPQIAQAVFGNETNQVARQAFARRKRGKALAFQAIEPASGTHPKNALGIWIQRNDGFAAQPILGAEVGALPRTKSVQPVATCSDPNVPVEILAYAPPVYS